MSQPTNWGVPRTDGGNEYTPEQFAERADDSFDALLSLHKGNSRPAYAEAGTLWLDDSSTPWRLKVFDGSDDITIGTINPSSNVFSIQPGQASAVSYESQSLDSGQQAQARENIDALGPEETPDRAFRQGNILGTVSQSSGVPTGAIIERGSNANGEYVRFADGTQMCRRAVTWNPSNGTSQIWYFPADFADTDRVSCSISFQATGNAQSRGAYLETTIGTTSSNTEWSVMTSSTVNAEYTISFFAIGRWF